MSDSTPAKTDPTTPTTPTTPTAPTGAARAALDWVKDGMTLGLGTGRAAAAFVDALGERVAQGLRITGVPTSDATAAQAEGLGIPLARLEDVGTLDITFDGADEVDGDLNLIKGYGAAMAVHMAGHRMWAGAWGRPLDEARSGPERTGAGAWGHGHGPCPGCTGGRVQCRGAGSRDGAWSRSGPRTDSGSWVMVQAWTDGAGARGRPMGHDWAP